MHLLKVKLLNWSITGLKLSKIWKFSVFSPPGRAERKTWQPRSFDDGNILPAQRYFPTCLNSKYCKRFIANTVCKGNLKNAKVFVIGVVCCIDVCSGWSGWCLDQQPVTAEPGRDKLFIQQGGKNKAMQHNNAMVLLLQHCQNTWVRLTVLPNPQSSALLHVTHICGPFRLPLDFLENLPPLLANTRTRAFHSRSRFKYDVEICGCGGLTRCVTPITMPALRSLCFHHRRERVQRSHYRRLKRV